MKPTFNQIISGLFALLCLVALVFMYFIKSKVPDTITGGIVVAFVVAFKDFANAFVKSASDILHADTTKQLITGLSDSIPAVLPGTTSTTATVTHTDTPEKTEP